MRFPVGLLAPVLLLSLGNYALRFWRWQLYLRWLGIALPRRSSLAVFVGGFTLSVTPGKAGELGKAWLVRALGGGPARRGVAAVLAERITDLLATMLLAALSAPALPAGRWIAAIALGAAVVLVLLLVWSAAARAAFAAAERVPWLGPRVGILRDVYARLRQLTRPAPLAVSLLLATLAWGAEATGFVLVLHFYADGLPWQAGVFDYCASTLAGGLTMLPGGLVAVEGAMTALLEMRGLDLAAAASATLVIRVATLWFAVLLGFLALPYLYRRLRR